MDVLVVDDTWVSGGSAQSAAVALKLAGARRVAIIVLGRHINPDDPRSAQFLAALSAGPLARSLYPSCVMTLNSGRFSVADYQPPS